MYADDIWSSLSLFFIPPVHLFLPPSLADDHSAHEGDFSVCPVTKQELRRLAFE